MKAAIDTTTSSNNETMTDLSDKVAIQGFEGSFHQIAAQQFFGRDVPVVCCASFGELFKKTADHLETKAAVMAIENSIAGSILPNYNLLQKSGLKIVGEVYLQIRHNLLVNPGIKLEDIREVHSHPMALQQCLDFLELYNWKLVETEDTALSAKQVHQHHSKHIAAIASTLSAELYELNVLAPDIQTQQNNYTRFLVLERQGNEQEIEKANKASINFNTSDKLGSLSKVLSQIADAGVNLSKLQSFPVPGSNWLYSFHADLLFNNTEQFNELITSLLPITSGLKIYGVYKSGLLK